MPKKLKLILSMKIYKTLDLHGGLECKRRKSRDTQNYTQLCPWSTKLTRAKTNRVLWGEHTVHGKHPFPTTQETTAHTRWLILKSDWSYSLQPKMEKHYQFSSVQSLSHVWLLATPWTAACQASLSITNTQSSSKPMSIESVMPSNHLILCRPLLLLPSIVPSIGVFSNKSALHIMWPKYWSFSFNISPSNDVI